MLPASMDTRRDMLCFTAAVSDSQSKEGSFRLIQTPSAESSHRDGKQDNAHLKAHGAKVFAGLLADLIREYDADERLKPIQDLLKGKNNDEADCGHSLD